MPFALPRQLFAAALACCAVTAVAAPTQRCNPTPVVSEILLGHEQPRPAFIDSIIAAVGLPSSNPELYERLVQPKGVRGGSVDFIVLAYEPVQDIAEIVDRLRADATIAPRLRYIVPNGVACSLPPPPVTQVITEYYNTTLNHYFLSSSPGENASIDSGGAGPGWVRTGQAWQTHQEDICSAPAFKSVYRFYGTPGIGPNSHFFTASPEECGGLRRGVGWGFEGFAFGAALPVNGACPAAAPVGLLRLYNNRWMFNDSNHRYTSDPQIYANMQAQGWVGEGVQLCVRATGSP